MVYLDNAATTAMSEAALNALMDVSANSYGNPSSVYGAGRKTKKILEESRKIIASCIGADPDEIYFTSCGSESDNWVLAKASEGKERIITSSVEHHAVLYPAEKLEKDGQLVVFLPVDDKCQVIESELIASLNKQPALVSIMLQNNEVGAIQNIRKISRIVHGDNPESLVHTDAVQAIGHTNINVKELGVDMLSASAHKFNGPKGVGFLYISKECGIAPFIIGGGQENGLRSGTENVAGIYSMAKALEDNVANLDEIHGHISKLDALLIDLLKEANIEFAINGDSSSRAAGLLNIAISGIDGEGLLNMLDMHDICISIGSACNSKSQDRSHVLTAMGLDEERMDSSVRISIGRYNTEEDIRFLVKWISNCCKIAKIAEA